MKTYAFLGIAFLLGCGSTSTQAVFPATDKQLKPPVQPAPEPTKVDLAKPRLQLALGTSETCLRVGPNLRCWAPGTRMSVPLLLTTEGVVDLNGVTDVAVGEGHTCAVVDSGKVFCWGDNTSGQLGARRTEKELKSPVRVEGINNAIKVAAGAKHTCVLLVDGHVSCWGWNRFGQTGSDSYYAEDLRELVVPEVVPGITDVTSLVAGGNQTCAQSNGETRCWGRVTLKWHETLVNVDRMMIQGETGCGLFRDGHVACWGEGAVKMLGTGQGGETLLSVLIPPARLIATGEHHGCAILQNGRVSCWGWNRHGEIGRTPREDYEPQPPGLVEGLPTEIDSLVVGPSVSCAITHRSEIWCWGIAPHLSSWDGPGSDKPGRVPIDP